MRESTGEARQRRRHPHKALDARTVQSSKVTNGRSRRLADGDGLYLLIAQNGSKSWVLRTVVRGRRCDIGLGGLSVVSLKQARDEAHRLRRIARSGGDPLAERRQARRVVPTFEEVAKQVHAEHGPAFKNEKHRKQWLASLGSAFTAFGGKRVDAVTSADVIGLLQTRWLTHPETSRRILQRMRVIFDWCRAQGHLAGDNPTVGVTKALPKHRGIPAHHPALPYDQVADFIVALRASDAGEPVKLAFEFMLLTASRTSETLKATWDEVDLDRKVWTVSAERMKAGIEHRVPLSEPCIAILRHAQAIERPPERPAVHLVGRAHRSRRGAAGTRGHPRGVRPSCLTS